MVHVAPRFTKLGIPSLDTQSHKTRPVGLGTSSLDARSHSRIRIIYWVYNVNMKEKTQEKLHIKTQKQILGAIGEDAACVYLERKGFKVIDRNYLEKWGELDIVVQKGAKIHFVEVKSVSRPFENVPHETQEGYRPEDNMHPWKLQRLARTIQLYLLDKNVSDDMEWQFDVATVYVDQEKRLCKVIMLEDVIL